MMFPAPPKPRTQPTQEGSNKESSYGYQHLWLRPQPTTFTFNGTFTLNGESSHDEGNPDPHEGKKAAQHDEDCSHYPPKHETRISGDYLEALGGLSLQANRANEIPYAGRLATREVEIGEEIR